LPDSQKWRKEKKARRKNLLKGRKEKPPKNELWDAGQGVIPALPEER